MSWAKKWFLKDPNSCFVTHWPPSVSNSWKSNSTVNILRFFLSSDPNSRELWLTRISAHDGQRFINCSQDGHTVVSVYLCTVLCITMQYPQADTGQIHRRVHTKVAVSWVHHALYVQRKWNWLILVFKSTLHVRLLIEFETNQIIGAV